MISKKIRLRRATRRESNCFRLYTFDDFCHYKYELAISKNALMHRPKRKFTGNIDVRTFRSRPIEGCFADWLEDSKQVWNQIRFHFTNQKPDQKTTEALVKMPELFVVF